MVHQLDQGSKEYQWQRRIILQLLWIIVVTVFMAELIIMQGLSFFLPTLSPLAYSLLDSALLISILFPLLYLLVFQRLFLQMAEEKEADLILLQRQRATATRLFVVILFTVFALELVIMLSFNYVLPRFSIFRSLVDSILLSTVLFPLLYLLVLQPLLESVTEHRKAEELLRESVDRFRSIAASAFEGIIISDPEDNIAFWNEGAERIFGYKQDEILNKNSRETLFPDQNLDLIGKLQEVTAINKDGTAFPVELSISPLKFRDKWGTMAIVRDISDRKKIERALKSNESSLARAQAIARLGNWDWDIDNNVLHWSDEIYRIFGLLPQEFDATYEAFLNYVHPKDRELLKQAVDKALKNGEPYNIDHRILRPDGSIRFVHEQAELVFDEKGNAVHMVGTVQDITERKELEKELSRVHAEEEKLKAIQTLSMTYAHNIFNTLTPLQGFAELLIKSMEPQDPRYKWCQNIIEKSKKISEIVDQLQAIESYDVTELGGVEILEIEKKKRQS